MYCLEYPNRTRIEHVDQFIIASKYDLKEEDLEELRKVRNLIINDVDVAIKTVFPCSRKISENEQLSIFNDSGNSNKWDTSNTPIKLRMTLQRYNTTRI